MKSGYFLILAVVFAMFATHAAFAKPNNMHKVVVSQKSEKPGDKVPSAPKNVSCINGTAIHPKH